MNDNIAAKLFWALLALVIAFVIFMVVDREQTSFLGVRWVFTSQSARSLWILFGCVVFAVAILLLVFSLKRPELNGFYSKPAITFRSQGDQAVQKLIVMIEGLSGNDRVAVIREAQASLPKSLSGQDVVAILGPLRGYNRQQAIELLASRINKDISAQEIADIMKGLSSYQRHEVSVTFLRDADNGWL